MGYEWEVWAYRHDVITNSYQYVIQYEGNDRDEAMAVADGLAKLGTGCIRIVWRP